ncbi:nucleoporin subcomplex protein binding to Pom34-domain-containing protein [Phyllosticta citribraziliensis]|uniref:Nucleoporin subcomplex protein binding to Pom34-domain-containing protein n=1 Tax=Phyllosticta citribraziliensis TaxID=989973 RepID=A0ABR1M195_9PEZI
MAAISGDAAVFPPLDRCLGGEQPLLSWKDVFSALSNQDPNGENDTLRNFLNDESVAAALNKPFEPFRPPNPQSKSSYETKTAAINVTPGENDHYDIKEIKADTEWLSGEANVNEIDALRIVLLEWQARPAAQLLSGFTEEETLSVQDAAGGANLGSSTFLPKSSIMAATASSIGQSFAGFNTLEQRRLRILEVYTSERIHILRVGDLIARIGAATLEEERSGTPDRRACAQWVQELGRKTFLAQGENSIYLGIEEVRVRLSECYAGDKWFKEQGGSVQAAELWSHCQFAEAGLLLQLIFTHADFASEPLPQVCVLSWFRLLEDFKFLRDVVLPFQTQPALVPHFQILVAMVSVAILNLPAALRFIETDGANASVENELQDEKWVHNTKCIQSLLDIFLIASEGPTPATLGAFAFVIFGLICKQESAVLAQERDHALTQGGAVSQNTLVEKIHDAFITIDLEIDDEPIVFLTKATVANARVHELISDLALNVREIFDGRSGRSDKGIRAWVDLHVENRMRFQLMSLIRDGMFTVQYSPEVILSVFAVVNGGQDYWDFIGKPAAAAGDPVLDAALAEDGLGILQEAKLRYPYETLPLLKFCRAACFAAELNEEGNLVVADWLQNKAQFTQTLPPKFVSYTPIREEENSYAVELTEDLSLFWNKKLTKRPIVEIPEGNEVVLAEDTLHVESRHILPARTVGYVLNPDARPLVVAWVYRHSVLRYLATHLSSYLAGNDVIELGSGEHISIEIASEYIGLLAMLITASIKAHIADADPKVEAQSILEDASEGLEDDQGDIISLIFDIFEQELQGLRERPNSEGSLELLVNCIQFIHALLSVFPNRVWPFFTRSRLLDIEGSGGNLEAVVSGTEMVAGRYDFLLSCARLLKALTDDCIGHAVSSRQNSRAAVRFAASPAAGGSSSDKIKTKVIMAFTKTLVGVFESAPSWRFAAVEQRLELNWLITDTFYLILQTVYGFDNETTDAQQKLFGVLAPAAAYVLDTYASESANDISVHALLNQFFYGTNRPTTTTSVKTVQLWTASTISALELTSLALQATVLLDLPTSYLEKKLFKASPLLARLSIAHESFKSPVLRLFETLVKSAARGDREPPSLLGHLGPETARAFLSVMSIMSGPLKDKQLEVDVWRLLSAVVGSKQQWFSIYLLTGNTPRDSLKSTAKQVQGRPRGKPVLQIALDELCEIQNLEPRRAVAMLQFICVAQNHWPWAVTSMHRHRQFLTSIMDFIRDLSQGTPNRPPGELVEDCIKAHMASLVADIGAMCLHYARQLGDVRPAQHVMAKLNYLIAHGVEPPSYNQSLHSNLKRNIERRFPGCQLSSFKKTALQKTEFGTGYYYDLEFAKKVIGFDQTWVGRDGNGGFSNELERANVNLSQVETQIMLLKSWKLLATELASIANKDNRLEDILTQVVEDCLRANQQATGSQQLFARLVLIRAEFAFVLMQKLVAAEFKGERLRGLFNVAWETIRLSGQDFDIAFVGEQADYYRTLLKILFLTLQPHVRSDAPLRASQQERGIRNTMPENTTQVLEILDKVVARGLQSLASQLHEDAKSVEPADFVLISGLLQSILRLPGIKGIQAEITVLFANCNTVRYAVSLFTWADKLIVGTDNDPVFGELSILFLLELSSLFPMAEMLAVEGVLSRLSTANLMNLYRRPRGMGPFDAPHRLFSIWVKGILPLCLNILVAVGPAVAPEVAAFLNQFPEQLARASGCLNPRITPTAKDPNAGGVNLGSAAEAHSLALISLVLERFRQENPELAGVDGGMLELKWDKAVVKEDVEGWVQGRRSLRERIVPVTEKEVELLSKKPLEENSSSENRLEERILGELTRALECLVASVETGQ